MPRFECPDDYGHAKKGDPEGISQRISSGKLQGFVRANAEDNHCGKCEAKVGEENAERSLYQS